MKEMPTTKLLIIDDDADFRQSLVLYFVDAGFAVSQASNGREGIEVFQREQPDIVFTDLRMPVMDGFEVISSITGFSPDTPIIVITGIGLIKEVIHATRLGATDYVVKPILEMDELKLIITRALRERSLREEIDSLKDKILSGQLRH